jgi:hypothetical protein
MLRDSVLQAHEPRRLRLPWMKGISRVRPICQTPEIEATPVGLADGRVTLTLHTTADSSADIDDDGLCYLTAVRLRF